MKKVAWTSYRKLMANLVPACVFVPLFAIGLMFYQRGNPKIALAFFIATPIAGWFAINFFALFENRKMKRELAYLTQGRASKPVFVGFSPPARVSMLDPHADVGWLYIDDDKIEFVGERCAHSIARREISVVRFRFNIHSVLGLGRWLSIEGRREGKQMRMLIEPREKSTLLQNRALGKDLLLQIREWLEQPRKVTA